MEKEHQESPEEECIREIKAFVHGGRPGLHLLNKVYPQIFKHFKIPASNRPKLLASVGLYMDDGAQRLKPFSFSQADLPMDGPREDDERV